MSVFFSSYHLSPEDLQASLHTGLDGVKSFLPIKETKEIPARELPERIARNPKTGAPVVIPGRTLPARTRITYENAMDIDKAGFYIDSYLLHFYNIKPELRYAVSGMFHFNGQKVLDTGEGTAYVPVPAVISIYNFLKQKDALLRSALLLVQKGETEKAIQLVGPDYCNEWEPKNYDYILFNFIKLINFYRLSTEANHAIVCSCW